MKLSRAAAGGGCLSCSLLLETASKAAERFMYSCITCRVEKRVEHTSHQPLFTERQSPKAMPTIHHNKMTMLSCRTSFSPPFSEACPIALNLITNPHSHFQGKQSIFTEQYIHQHDNGEGWIVMSVAVVVTCSLALSTLIPTNFLNDLLQV
jgi:hypothetical protein